MTVLYAEVIALWRVRALCWVLTRREVSVRYAGTALGVTWAYIQPLLTMAAYYLVFDVVFAMRMGEGSPTRAVGAYLIVGLLPWMSFCDAIMRGMGSLVEAGGVLQKNALPPMLFPVRAVLASGIVYMPLMLLLVLAYIPQHHFSWALSVLPLLLVLQWLVCTLWGAVLAVLAAALRDTMQVVAFALSIGVFLSPVLFPSHMFPADWRWVLWLNPMTGWIGGYQALLLQGAWPDWSVWLGCVAWLVVGAAFLELVLRRSRDQLIDWL